MIFRKGKNKRTLRYGRLYVIVKSDFHIPVKLITPDFYFIGNESKGRWGKNDDSKNL